MRHKITLMMVTIGTLVANVATNFRRPPEVEANGDLLMASIKAEGLKFPPESYTNADGEQEIARGFGRINALAKLRAEFPAWWKETYPKDQIPVYSHGKLTREQVTSLKNDYGRPISKAGAYLLYRDLRDCGHKVKAAIVRMLSPLQQAFGVGREIDADLKGQERLDAYTKRYYGTVKQGFEYIRDFKGTVVEELYLENVDLSRRDFRVKAASIAKLHKAYQGDCEASATTKHPETGLLPESQKCWALLIKEAAAEKAKSKNSTVDESGSTNAEVAKFRNSLTSQVQKMTMDMFVGIPVEGFVDEILPELLKFEEAVINPILEKLTKKSA